jgi:molecular chaperone DnaJ
MTVPLETVIFGGAVDVTMLAPRPCGTCNGNGKLAGRFACPSCGGDGKDDHGRNCRRCSGYGAVKETRCTNCSGKGVVKTEKAIRVTVPPGVVEGTVLRVKGAGGPGLNGGAPGSAFCRIKIQAHRTYTLHGLTLTRGLTVDFVTAMLGGAVPVELFGVQVKVAVPPMTRAGKIITMEKAGLKNSKTGENGDLRFRVVIDLPASAHQLRSEHKEILRAMFNAAAAR